MLSGIIIVLVLVLAIALPIILICAIINAIRKSKDNKKEDSFAKTIKTIYVYMLLVIFLCMMVGCFLGVFSYALDYFLPEEDFDSTVVGQNDKNEIIANLWTTLAGFVISVPMFIYLNNEVKQVKVSKEQKEIEST